TRETGVISPTDLPILVLSSPGVPLRATLTQFALLVDVDTQESVVELRVLASSVVKLAIYRRIATRTPLRVHLVRLIRSQKSGDRHQPTSQQSSHRSHGHNNDHHGSDRRGGSDNHHSSNNNYSGSNNRNSGYGRDQRNRGQQSNRSANSGSQQSRGPSEGSSYPVCTTCGRRHPGECRRATGTCFKCGQAGHLQKDCKKNTTAGTSGQADKKPGASGHVFAITEGHAANSSVPTPMVEQAKLKLDLVGEPVDHTDYRSMIGSLMHVTSSRPDIMFATCMCARYQANPNEHHVSAVKRIF
nr:hypothetical protein [Tanacetum cinerariifolium]